MAYYITPQNIDTVCEYIKKVKQAILNQTKNIENFEKRFRTTNPDDLLDLYNEFETFDKSYKDFIKQTKKNVLWKQNYISINDKTTISMLENKRDIVLNYFKKYIDLLEKVKKTGFSSVHDPNEIFNEMDVALQESQLLQASEQEAQLRAEFGEGVKRRKTKQGKRKTKQVKRKTKQVKRKTKKGKRKTKKVKKNN